MQILTSLNNFDSPTKSAPPPTSTAIAIHEAPQLNDQSSSLKAVTQTDLHTLAEVALEGQPQFPSKNRPSQLPLDKSPTPWLIILDWMIIVVSYLPPPH